MPLPPPDPRYILRGSDGEVISITYVTIGTTEMLAAGTSKGSIHVWNLETQRVCVTLSAHNGESVLWLHMMEDRQLLSQGRDGVLNIWAVGEGGTSLTKSDLIPCGKLGFCQGAYTTAGDDQFVAVPSEESSQICVYRLNPCAKHCTLAPQCGGRGYGMCMATQFTLQHGKLSLLVAYENGSIALWDVKSALEIAKCHIHKTDSVMAFRFSDQLNCGISGSVDEKLCVWNVIENDRGMNINVVQEMKLTNPGINCVRIRSDCKIYVTGGWDSKIRVFNMKKHKLLAVLSYHSQSVNCLDFSSNKFLAAGSRDGLISVWDIYRTTT